MRKFYLIDDKNKRYDLQNVDEKCFFINPGGLGYENGYSYIGVGNYFFRGEQEVKQKLISGILCFGSNEEYQKFIDYVEKTDELRLSYVPVDKEFFLDVDLESIDKTEIEKGYLSCEIRLCAKGLFYTDDEQRFIIESLPFDSTWDLSYPFTWNDAYDFVVPFINNGHTEAEFVAEFYGPAETPTMEIYCEEYLYKKVKFDISLLMGESLIYSVQDKQNSIYKVDALGNKENVVRILNIEYDNFAKLPKGKSTMVFKALNGNIGKVILRTFKKYKGV